MDNDWTGFDNKEAIKKQQLEKEADKTCAAMIDMFQSKVDEKDSIYKKMGGGETLMSALRYFYENRETIDALVQEAYQAGFNGLRLFNTTDKDGIRTFAPANALGECLTQVSTPITFPHILALRHWLTIRYKGAVMTQWLDDESLSDISIWWLPKR
jgi:hypothetical protein